MSNLAAIDVGSNAIRMLIGRLHTDGRLETLENLRLPVRLGQDAFTIGYFSHATMQMAVEAFLRFRQVAELFSVNQSRSVATSAMRESANSDLLLDRIAKETGYSVEIISEEEEARLIHLAVKHTMDLNGKICLLIDIGGGSVEVTLSDGENILATESFRMGTVRLLNQLEAQNRQKLPLNSLLREYAASANRYIKHEIEGLRIGICCGTGGNIEEMGKLRRRLLGKRRSDLITLDDLEQLIDRLGPLSVEERMQKFDLNSDRADVILPAMIVLQTIARQARITQVQIPGVGLKDGVLLEMAPLALGPSLPRRVQVLASVERMGRKYAYDAEHAAIVAEMAKRLFNQSLSLHHLTENERLLLEAAAMLHDIGHYVNTIDHDRHGYYLIRHQPLIGLFPAEQEIVANLVYYHRRQNPLVSENHDSNVSQTDRIIIAKLCALLRLADALDVSHLARIQDVILEQHQSGIWRLHLVSNSEAMLERWALQKRKTLFQDIFGVKLEVV